MSLYSTCRPHLEAARAARPDPLVPVWDFKYHGWPWSATWRAFPAAQTAVLRAFLAEAPHCYLQMEPSDVLEWSDAKGWARPYKETFHLPSALDAATLTKKVLYVGGYRLYCAPGPVEPSLLGFDAWRTPPSDLVDSIQKLGITALIAAFYDDDAWRISFPSELAT